MGGFGWTAIDSRLAGAQEDGEHVHHEVHGWAEEQPHDETAQNEDDDETETADGVEGVQRIVGQQVADDATGVERWNGDEVEEDQREIDLDQQPAKKRHSLGSGGCTDKDLILNGGDDSFTAARQGEDENHQHQDSEQGHDQIDHRAGERDQVVVERYLFEIAGDDGHGFAPAEDDASTAEADEWAEDHEGGIDDCAEDIDVAGGIEGDAAFEAGGVVAEAGGHPGLRALMAGDREQQDDKLIERNYQVNA